MSRLGARVVLAGPNGAGKSRLLGLAAAAAEEKYTKAGVLNLGRLSTQLEDPQDRAQSENKGMVEQIHDPAHGVSFQRLALSYIGKILDHEFNATHQRSTVPPDQRRLAEEDAERLQALSEQLLGARLDRRASVDGSVTLRGNDLASRERRISEGQASLIELVARLHAQEAKLGELIIFWDEPELHLHPAAVSQALERLERANARGQIWLATHSVPLVAASHPPSLWFVNDNELYWSGKAPEALLAGLLGAPHGVERMRNFMDLPVNLAAATFASECLSTSAAVTTSSNDAQLALIRDHVRGFSANGKLAVLDYGAGRGRLLRALAEEENANAVTIEYMAVEPDADAQKACSELVAEVYGQEGVGRVFSRVEDLRGKLASERIGAIVMCNVLHELDPAKWISFFKDEAHAVLADNGVLLVVEDYELPHGEMAHEHGFLLLDRPELDVLFPGEGVPPDIVTSERRDGRLKAHAIPRARLASISEASRTQAIRVLRDRARDKVRELRKSGESTYANGRRYALWTQLYCNAGIYLDT
jgi:ABC-type cobalamin/Fe3+-siderophores transport system ATPase subunit/cyclopropane fatty-acyl-phospholipid synthase-like methyltransferase